MEQDALRQLCALARIDLTEAEEAEFSRKFNSLLSFVEQLVAYQSVEQPTAAAMAERKSEADSLKLRRDEVRPAVWPEGTEHQYSVGQIINFEGDG